jgi:bacterioferritin (cytochrome b1)
MSNTTDLLTQLNALLRLTNTEVLVAETRRSQASTPDFERELSANADKGRERAEMLADAIRELGGVPDVVGVAAGRVTATAKATLEQGQEFIEAVLGDLALENELLSRTRVAAMMAEHLEVRPSVRRTLDRLERAHSETVDWLMTRLAEVAAGGPAALRPTPLQSAVGFGRRLGTMPVRNVSGTLNRSIDGVGRARRQAAAAVRTNGGRVRQLVDAAGEIWTAGRDASLKRTEELAEDRGDTERARAVNQRRRDLGAVDGDELPIRGYDRLRVDAAVSRIERLTTVDDVRAVLAYETANKARKGVLEAAQARIDELASRLAAVS